MKSGSKAAADESRRTHLLLNGGIWNVPWERHDELLRNLAADLRDGTWNYVVELRTDVFRFFVDLDVDCEREVREDEWRPVYLAVLRVIARFFGGDKPHKHRVVVSKADPKQRTKDGKPVVKTGRHLVFPEVLVRCDTALRLHEAIVREIRESGAMPEIARDEQLEEVVDERVYQRNGIRLAGQRKGYSCGACRRRDESPGQEACTKCHGLGFVDEGRPYWPADVLDGDGVFRPDELRHMQDDVTYVLRETTIRTPPGTKPTKFNRELLEQCTDEPDEQRLKGIGKRSKRGKGSKHRKGSNPVQLPTRRGCEFQSLPETDLRCAAVETWLVRAFECKDDPPHVRVLKLSRGLGVYIAVSRSHYCRNKQARHNQSTVYFWISASDGTAVQRCYCHKGTCPGYSSPPVPLPPDLRALLFPPRTGLLSLVEQALAKA